MVDAEKIAWIQTELQRVLGESVTEIDQEVAAYVADMNSACDIRDFVVGIARDAEGRDLDVFIENLLCFSQKPTQSPALPRPPDSGAFLPPKRDVRAAPPQSPPRSKRKQKTSGSPPTTSTFGSSAVQRISRSGQSKTGSVLCNCQCTEHPLIANCLSCGKLVCAAEGTQCYFCGTSVLEGLDDTEKNEAYQKALEAHQKLVRFEELAKQRTRVYDDEKDYFSESKNKYRSKEARQLAKTLSEREAQQKTRVAPCTLQLDFGSRTVSQANPIVRPTAESIAKGLKEVELADESFQKTDGDASLLEIREDATDMMHLIRDNIEELSIKQDQTSSDRFEESNASGKRFVTLEERAKPISLDVVSTGEELVFSVDDAGATDGDKADEFDKGVCLTMHQPWASLLVMGVKQLEGRTWGTEHRGKLWIHAASKIPDPQDIAFLASYYGSRFVNCEIPKTYPTSCLVGRVDVVDCWNQEEYAEKRRIKNLEESSSPYLFVCENPQKMMCPIKMAGRRGLWRLPASQIGYYQKGLMKTLKPKLK